MEVVGVERMDMNRDQEQQNDQRKLIRTEMYARLDAAARHILDV